MLTALSLFESASLKDTIKTQFKKIKKNTDSIDTVFNKLIQNLDEKYTVSRNGYELSIKVDKRKNIEHVRKEVQGLIDDIQLSFDKTYLFNVKVGQNEIIVRARRNK